MSLLDDQVNKTLGLHLQNPMDASNTAAPADSLNKEYNTQVEKGKFKGSFADFMKHLDVNKALQSGDSILQNVRALFGKNNAPVDYTGANPTGPGTPMNPWLKGTLWVGGIGGAVVIVILLVKKFKKQK